MYEEWFDKMLPIIRGLPEYRYALFAEGDEGATGGSGEGEGQGDNQGGDGGGGEQGDGEGAAGGGQGDGAAGSANGAGTDDWREHIQDTKLRDHAGRFTSVVDLLGKHFELRQQLSTAIQPLGKDATDEQVEAYRKATGVPKTAEEYVFALPEGRESTEADKAFQASAAGVFHKFNIPVETAKGLNEWFNDIQVALGKAQIDADTAYAKETEAALKVEWPGKEFELNKAFADRAAAKVFGDAFDDVKRIETKDGRFVLDNPAFVRMLAGIGREMSEGRLGSVMTEGDQNAIENQIDELEGKIEKATNEGDGEKANKLYIEQQELYRKLHGSVPIVGSEGRTA